MGRQVNENAVLTIEERYEIIKDAVKVERNWQEYGGWFDGLRRDGKFYAAAYNKKFTT